MENPVDNPEIYKLLPGRVSVGTRRSRFQFVESRFVFYIAFLHMKTLKLLLLVLLLHSQAFFQVSLGYFFPMGVMGITYGDSLLNTSAVLKAAGIRKITSLQTSNSDLKTGFSPIITYLNANGKIEKVVFCMPRPGKTPPIICMSDTVFYDSGGRMLRTVSKDASGLAYLQVDADYSVGGKIKYTLVYSSHQQPRNDTDISYRYYNEGGQLVGLVYAYGDQRKLTPLSATVYYNADGLPDSIRHDNPAIGSYIFKRIQKGTPNKLSWRQQRIILAGFIMLQVNVFHRKWVPKKGTLHPGTTKPRTIPSPLLRTSTTMMAHLQKC
jgi:hypothetical protein